jgi:hypothetical protein
VSSEVKISIGSDIPIRRVVVLGVESLKLIVLQVGDVRWLTSRVEFILRFLK